MLINEHLMTIPATDPLSDNVAPCTAVIFYQTNHTALIAKGIISEHAHQAPLDGINITPKCVVVEIQEVLVPGAIIITCNKKKLQDFGPPPFSAVCLKSHIQLLLHSYRMIIPVQRYFLNIYHLLAMP